MRGLSMMGRRKPLDREEIRKIIDDMLRAVEELKELLRKDERS